MLVFLSQEHDRHCDWMAAECDRREVEHVRVCTEQFPRQHRISIEPASENLTGHWRLEDRVVELKDITGLWYRRPGPITIDPEIPEGLQAFARVEAAETLRGLYRTLHDRRWVSPPHKLQGAGHKMHQLRLAKELGFQVAPTLITNDPDTVVEFFQRCGEQMIYKPLRFVPIRDEDGDELGIYTNRVTRDELESCLQSVPVTPCLFQQLVPKAYELRVNVIGDRVWSAAIHSQEMEHTALDCRHDLEHLRHTAIHLPAELEARCIEMTRHLGLRMGNIDFIVTPDGEYSFLELNPNGQFVWIEIFTGLPLCQALADELLGVDTLSEHPYLHGSLDFEPSFAYPHLERDQAQEANLRATGEVPSSATTAGAVAAAEGSGAAS